VSPQGKRIVFGGRSLGAVLKVIDTATFSTVASFQHSAFAIFGWSYRAIKGFFSAMEMDLWFSGPGLRIGGSTSKNPRDPPTSPVF
jgi:hypothetical protein